MMKLCKILSISLFFTLLLTACASTTTVSDENSDKKVFAEKETQKQKEETIEKQQKAEALKKEEERQYDGERYVGKAKKTFSKGVESYFQEGCSVSIDKWKESYEKDPLPQISFNIALCYERTENNTKAFDWYLKSFEADLNNAKPLYNAYFVCEGTDKIKFDTMMKHALEIKDAVEKNIFISWLNLKKNDLKNTMKYAKKALKLDEQSVDAMIVLGRAYYRKKMIELATSIFSTAEQINPDDFKLQRMYGFLEYDKKNKSSALLHFQKAKKLNPEMPEVLNMIAILYMETEDFVMAEKELQSALSLNPGFYAAKLNLAIVYKGLGKFKEAAELFNSFAKDKKFPQKFKKRLYYNKAILYLDADVNGDKDPGRYDIAVEALKKYLEFVPKNDKEEKKKISEYLKEAKIGKKKLLLYQKMLKRREQKKKAAEEEEKKYRELQKKKAEEIAKKNQAENDEGSEAKKIEEKDADEGTISSDEENAEKVDDTDIQN